MQLELVVHCWMIDGLAVVTKVRLCDTQLIGRIEMLKSKS